jgi:protease-4
VLKGFTENQNYVAMDLRGPVRHTRFKYFDQSMTLSQILASLEGARTDHRVAGVALNLSGVKLSNGSAWEIREKLAQIQRDGKHVVVFVDNAGMAAYHVASVADHVVMDPQGMFMLPGFAMGRTYLNRLAEKLGVGVEEWRFKDYKSAMEGLVRRDMSPEDREQRQALVDEYYSTFRSEVASSRRVEESSVDEWIDEMVIIMPHDAVEQGMVDELALWDNIGKVVADLEGSGKSFIKAHDTARFAYPAVEWGEPDRIAVVYAIGGTEMDSGMNARRVQKTIRALKRNRTVKAVVLRVNSPGGDAMASNVVAEAILDCRKVKPVIVSQADVAASGGYWVSMYADEIIAQPTTITGSIGVIAGWVWDDGLSDKLGVDTDHVKAGKHADLFVNMRLPFLPIGIPYRQVTDEERDQALREMEKMYNGFIAKVAEGRGMTEDAVAEIAKGRVWTGAQGLENGLVDRIGGLYTAIDVAREKAGLEKDDYVQVVEFGSSRGLFNPDFLRPLPLSFHWFGGGDGEVSATTTDPASFMFDYEMFYLERLTRFNGRPQCLLPPEYLPQTAGEEMR